MANLHHPIHAMDVTRRFGVGTLVGVVIIVSAITAAVLIYVQFFM